MMATKKVRNFRMDRLRTPRNVRPGRQSFGHGGAPNWGSQPDWETLDKPAYLRRGKSTAKPAQARSAVVSDVTSALQNLGYKPAAARELASAAHRSSGSQSFDTVFRAAMTSARKNPPVRKFNPAASIAAAARLHKRFIGKRATKVVVRKTKHPAAASARGGKLPVARMATLTYLKVRNPHLKDGLIQFPVGKRPRLLAHPSGRQYYVEGGDQRLSGIPFVNVRNPGNVTPQMLRRAGIDPDDIRRKLVPLGEVEEIGYFERKAVEQFKPVEYYHAFGEENGKRPDLVYDPKNAQIHLVGGDYRTLTTGINN
jgi:hypothetical protein